jgi:hypothetical protein
MREPRGSPFFIVIEFQSLVAGSSWLERVSDLTFARLTYHRVLMGINEHEKAAEEVDCCTW